MTETAPQPHRTLRMPHHYKRDPLGKLEREALARALILPWMPAACPKCCNQVLRRIGVEVSCVVCGWEQVVRQ